MDSSLSQYLFLFDLKHNQKSLQSSESNFSQYWTMLFIYIERVVSFPKNLHIKFVSISEADFRIGKILNRLTFTP